MRAIQVSVSTEYDVLVGKRLMENAPAEIRAVTDADSLCIVSDHTVWALYGDELKDSFTDAGFPLAFWQGCCLILVNTFRIFFFEQDLDRLHHALDVQPQTIILNIGQIQPQFVVRRCIIFTINLGIPGQAAFHLQPVIELRHIFFILLHDLRALRPRADQ